MQQQIGQQVSVSFRPTCNTVALLIACEQIDTITRTLQSRCGSFCRPEDVILYKVSAPAHQSVKLALTAIAGYGMHPQGQRQQDDR